MSHTRRRRAAAVLLAAAGMAAACGAGPNEPEKRLLALVSKTAAEPRSFVYEEGEPCEIRDRDEEKPDESLCVDWEPRVVVHGRVEDDLRFSATLFVDDEPWVDQVVIDDALAVRLHPAARSFAQDLAADDTETLRALLEGRWVIDYEGAPPLIAPVTREGSIGIGRFPILDASYTFQHVRRSIADAAGAKDFNPDELTYQAVDDPFFRPDEKGGERRMEIVPPPLPRPSQRGTSAAQPSAAQFREMAFYIVGDRIARIVEQTDVKSQRDFRRVLDGSEDNDYFRGLLGSVLEGNTREPVVERRMVYKITTDVEAPPVELPLGDALISQLADTIGPRGLGFVGRPTVDGEEQETGAEAGGDASGG